jgi:hypothetical protein
MSPRSSRPGRGDTTTTALLLALLIDTLVAFTVANRIGYYAVLAFVPLLILFSVSLVFGLTARHRTRG